MKFKAEVSLLIASILMFALSVFFYSYQGATVAAQTATDTFALTATEAMYPYRGLALVFVGLGAVSMVTASVSFQKRSKTLI